MTTELAAARLIRLKQVPAKGKDGKPSYDPDPQGSFEVQFNPTSLRISRSNNIDRGGTTTRTQRRQTPSAEPATLAFDLEFDTAEGDAQGQPTDVRTLTRMVRQFTEPTREKPKDPPPAVRFAWGTFMFQGIVTQLTEELDYFSADGMPLRAKVSLTITEQNPEWEAGDVGPGARDARASRRPTTTAQAQDGESVQQLLSRLDQDPAGWRDAMAGLDSPLGLPAGAQVQLGGTAGLGGSLSAGLGGSLSAGLGGSLRAGVGGGASGGFSAGLGGGFSAGATASTGFALSESGGISASATAAASMQVGAAEAQARASFAVPGVSASASASVSASASASVRVTAPDPRSLGYGRGIPLRARVSWSSSEDGR